MRASDDYILSELTAWFRQRLDELSIRFDDEPFNYEANTAYDIAFYRLLAEARDAWLARHGYTPTPGQLTKAFFNAEFERSRENRLARRNWLSRAICRLFPSKASRKPFHAK
ncbi:hypothetical protein ACWJKU_18705 [Methylocaldum sp. MU1018]